jgi:ABC-type multidrug transport system ATPase subunit
MTLQNYIINFQEDTPSPFSLKFDKGKIHYLYSSRGKEQEKVMRSLLGLNYQSKFCDFNGEPLLEGAPKIFSVRKWGFFLDGFRFYGHMSIKENLNFFYGIRGETSRGQK